MEKKILKDQSLADQLVQARLNGVANFGSVSHRLAYVDSVDGVEFIDDSKSTDLGAAEDSLEYVQKPLVWIVGASDLEEDYDTVLKLVTYKVRGIIVYGKDTSKIGKALSRVVEYYVDVEDVTEAVKIAHGMSKAGEAVLFSPACSSYPHHSDFKERGQVFCNAVAALRTFEGCYVPERYSKL
jgi:UDP-N-acetylmuramoylalanine--D-glutamate ligase